MEGNFNSNEQLPDANKSICKVLTKHKEFVTGFFAKIPISGMNTIAHALIIDNIFIKLEDISEKQMKIIINNNTTKVLELQNPRTIYREKEEDGITIIEIIPSDNLDTNSFLEIDSNIIQNQSIYKNLNKEIFLINIQNEQKYELLQSKIKNINSDIYEIEKFNSKENIEVGSPIIQSDNLKLIGIYKGYDNKSNRNIGAFFKVSFEGFIIKHSERIQKINDINNKINGEINNKINNKITIIF